jgi:hypothetical protein
MKRLISLLILIAVSFLNDYSAQTIHSANWVWALQGGGMGFDHARSVATDGSDNIFVLGDFNLTATFGDDTLISAGSEDVYVAKYNSEGNLIWIEQIGGTEFDRGNGIATDNSNNCVVTGRFNGTIIIGDTSLISNGYNDIFVAKYDSEGNFLWVEQAGGTGFDRGNRIKTDDLGNIVVTGRFETTAFFGDTSLSSFGTEDIFVAKYDAAGSLLWVNQAGGTAVDRGQGIATDASGNTIVTGRFGDIASFGDTMLTSLGSIDIFVAKYDIDGNLLWVQQAGGDGWDRGLSIETDNLGNIVVTGEFEFTATFGDTSLICKGYRDIFVAKYDSDGNFLWAEQAGGTGWDCGFGAEIFSFGNSVATGVFEETAFFGDTSLTSAGWGDIFVIEYDNDGNLLWVNQAGGGGHNLGESIAIDGDDNIVVSGEFADTVTFGETTLVSAGGKDMYVAKLERIIVDVQSQSSLLKEFWLYQNYPNPYNPVTKIKYQIPELCFVTLKVYDILGREVTTLVNEEKPIGSYDVEFSAIGGSASGGDAYNLSSGIYFYRLQAGDFFQTKKMILLK